jgi:hypothetical protein
MVWVPDSPDLWAPDSATPNRRAPDSGGHLTLGRAVDLFLAAKAAEGAAAKTLEWYGMILRRAVRGLGDERPIEQLAGPELRAWILELRSTLSPISVVGYVRTLKVLGNWLAAEELAQAAALRTLRKPRVPDKLVERIGDDAMRRLLTVADVRDRRSSCSSSILGCGSRRMSRSRARTTSRTDFPTATGLEARLVFPDALPMSRLGQFPEPLFQGRWMDRCHLYRPS